MFTLSYTLLGALAILGSVRAAPYVSNTSLTAGAGHTNTTATKISSTILTHNLDIAGTYSLVNSFDASNFWDSFSFFGDSADPTNGDVQYTTYTQALADGIISTNDDQVYMGVDWTTVDPPNGRASVRVTSNTAYTHGLFIADIAHMPGSICGVWPSWWLFGPNWPANGEIDIIEGVNQNTLNTITLHTAAGCTISTTGSQAATALTQSNCNAGSGNTGCGATTGAAYGDSFNSGGGGVYAMQWESSGIYVWYFPQGSVPSDVLSGSPSPDGWGTPVVAFDGGSGCDVDAYFAEMNMVFDTTFCGDWAGSVWRSGGCAAMADSCDDYVNGNPAAFQGAYWLVNSVSVYQL